MKQRYGGRWENDLYYFDAIDSSSEASQKNAEIVVDETLLLDEAAQALHKFVQRESRRAKASKMNRTRQAWR